MNRGAEILALLVALLLALSLPAPAPAAGQDAPAPAAGGMPSSGSGGGPAAAIEPKTSLPDIEDEVMCPVCGVPLEHAIDAPQARQERELIRGLIAAGLTKDEIKDRLVAEFGPEVLAVPEASGFDLAAWLVPGAGILAAALGIAFALRRWRRAAREAASGSSEGKGEGDAGDGAESGTEDRARLERDLARYEI